jgi:drug/metabolite transporter (DMT)-like permease
LKTKIYLATFCVAFFWGTTYLAIAFGIETIPPLLVSGYRNVIAGLVLLLYVFVNQKYTPLTASQWKRNATIALLMIVLGNGLTTISEKYITSGLAAIICTLSPLVIFILNLILGHEKPSAKTFFGIILAFTGILYIHYDNLKDLLNPDYQLGIVLVFGAILTWSIGTIITKKTANTGYLWLNIAVQMLLAGVVLCIIQFFVDPTFSPSTYSVTSLLALAYLTIFGSIIGYGAYSFLLKHLPSTQVAALNYVNVVVALFFGWKLKNEIVTTSMILGTIIILTGVFIVNHRKNNS